MTVRVMIGLQPGGGNTCGICEAACERLLNVDR